MRDFDMLGTRIDELEARFAYQDETIETLNQTVAAQWKKIDALTRQLAALSDRMQQAESSIADRKGFEPPPHY